MTVPIVLPGRGGFKPAGHDTGLGPYGRVVGKLLDGSQPTKDSNYEAVAYGVGAIQSRLNDYLAYFVPEAPQIPVTRRFGIQSAGSTVWFQKHEGLKPDGRPGLVTCEALWHDLFVWFAGIYGVPVNIVWGMSRYESGFDPGAVSVIFDPDIGPDRGLGQISQQHLDVISLADMFDPQEAISYLCERFAKAMRKYDDKGPDLQLVCSIASHNRPASADEWYEVGSMGDDTTIAKYVARVKASADLFVAK